MLLMVTVSWPISSSVAGVGRRCSKSCAPTMWLAVWLIFSMGCSALRAKNAPIMAANSMAATVPPVKNRVIKLSVVSMVLSDWPTITAPNT